MVTGGGHHLSPTLRALTLTDDRSRARVSIFFTLREAVAVFCGMIMTWVTKSRAGGWALPLNHRGEAVPLADRWEVCPRMK